MTDRELLERCAKVIGKKVLMDSTYGVMRDVTGTDPAFNFFACPTWNPLTSVADAAELAIKCKVDVYWQELLGCVQCNYSPAHRDIFISARAYFKDHPTERAAYCYAVCQVVAQMGGE